MTSCSSPADGRPEVVIVDNPIAGTCDRSLPVQELVRALEGLRLTPVLCRDRAALGGLVSERADRLRCVVAAGGDGTLNDVLNRVPGVPVAVLPLGNENLVAQYFHVGRCPAQLARAIAAGAVRRLDLGRINGRLFSLMASAGIDAQVVHDVHRVRRGHINKWNYVGPIVRALARYRFPAVHVTVEETGEQLHGAMAFVFNLPMYGLGLPLARRACADDGSLDLLVFQRPGVVHLGRYVAALLAGGRHERLPDVQVRRVRKVTLRAERPVPVQIDGDPAGRLPATVEVAPATFHLVAPAGFATNGTK